MKKIVWLIVIAVFIIMGVHLIGKRKANLATLPTVVASLQAVEVIKARSVKERTERTFVGTLDSEKKTTISTRVSEKVIFIAPYALVVEKGDILVRLDESEMDQMISQSKHQLKAIEHTLQGLLLTGERLRAELAHEQTVHARNNSLFAIGGISKETFDASSLSLKQKELMLQNHLQTYQATKSEYASAEAILASRLSQSEHYTLHAPYDAIVLKQIEEVGSISKPGSPLLELSNMKKVVKFSYTGDLTLGQEVEVEGAVGQITKLLPQTSQLLKEAEASFGNSIEKPLGTLVHVKVFGGIKEGYALPLRALLQENDKSYVLAYTGNYFEKIEVSVILQNSKMVIIEEELKMPIAIGSPSKLAPLHLDPHVRLVSNE